MQSSVKQANIGLLKADKAEAKVVPRGSSPAAPVLFRPAMPFLMCLPTSDRYRNGNADLHYTSVSPDQRCCLWPVSSKLHDAYTYVVLSSMQLCHQLLATAQ